MGTEYYYFLRVADFINSVSNLPWIMEITMAAIEIGNPGKIQITLLFYTFEDPFPPRIAKMIQFSGIFQNDVPLNFDLHAQTSFFTSLVCKNVSMFQII